MRPVMFQPDNILRHFHQRKVLTMAELRSLCGCSHMTAWRTLHDCGYYTSYNFNAKYYTLAHIPVFDALGLWSFGKVRFSQYGSLTQTIVALVSRSEAGYNAQELTPLLGVRAGPALSRLHSQARIHREKVGNAFVYVAGEAAQREAQIKNRERQHKAARERCALPDADRIIAVLVELVQRPQLQPKALAARLRRRGVGITVQEIQAIFTRYDLAGKRGHFSC